MPSIILSDNGVSSGSAGLKSTAASDGALALQTTTAGGSATTAALIDTSQNVLVGMSSYGVTNAGVSLSPTASSSFYVAGGTAVTIGRGVSNGTAVQFNRSGTNVGTIDVATTGLTMTGTNGITFTAAQSASSDANTLDDYEEGTCTLTIQGVSSVSGQSYSTQNARYTKVGNLCQVAFDLRLTALGTTSGAIVIAGLPFTAIAGDYYGGGPMTQFQSMGASFSSLAMYANPSTTYAYVTGVKTPATSASTLTPSDLTNTTWLWGTLVYQTA